MDSQMERETNKLTDRDLIAMFNLLVCYWRLGVSVCVVYKCIERLIDELHQENMLRSSEP
jgi:hypothetical protein